MPVLITLVNDNHVDNYIKEILAFEYYGLIVNNQPKNNIILGRNAVHTSKNTLMHPTTYDYLLISK